MMERSAPVDRINLNIGCSSRVNADDSLYRSHGSDRYRVEGSGKCEPEGRTCKDPMRLLLVVPHYIPEIGSAAHIYSDLAVALQKRGHEVDVITSYPRDFNVNGPSGKDCPLEETINGIEVHRCVHSSTRDSIIRRGIEHYLIPHHYYRLYCRLKKRFDASIIYVPPLALYYFSDWIKKRDGVPSILNYQDYHPQELTDVGVLKNKVAIMLMERLEKKSYRNADFITVISPGGIDYIKNKGCHHDRIANIYNGVLLSDLDKPVKRDFKTKWGMDGKTLVSYAGILSPFQGIDNILNSFKKLKTIDDLVLFIVGDGMLKEHLATRVRDENIYNVRLLPLQPREEYNNIINSSDICLVSLDERMRAPCVPGKLANLMAAEKAIVAIVHPECETARVISQAGCGIVVEPGNDEALRKAVLGLKDDPALRSRLGKNGRAFVQSEMNLEKAAKEYERIVTNLVENQYVSKGSDDPFSSPWHEWIGPLWNWPYGHRRMP